MISGMVELIQFNKTQTAVSIKWLIEVISELGNTEEASKHIDKLSLILAVMRRCHEAAPSLPDLPPSTAGKDKKL